VTPAEQAQLEDGIPEVKADLKPETEDNNSKGWLATAGHFPKEHPEWLVIGGLLLLIVGKKATSSTAGH